MTKPEGTWEEEFDEQFWNGLFSHGDVLDQYETVKSFIHSLLLSQRQATIQEVREMTTGMKKLEIQDAAREQDYARQRVVGYNRALVDLAAKLTDLK